MKIIRTKKDTEAFIRKLRGRAAGASPAIRTTVQRIITQVQKGGDPALLKLTQKYDGFRPKSVRLSRAEIKKQAALAEPKVLSALKLSIKRVRDFHNHQKESSWSYTQGGATLGQVVRPIQRAGVYVPGGRAAYPSTVLMNVIPAQVAGVPEIALCVPTPRGETDPHVMAAIELLGVKEVYCIGGAQAVAAMAWGTKTIKPVDKIVGPGNVYVAEAKRMVFGQVDIDMVAGPSEILIIADAAADPAFIAADLLSQAEHDPLASSVLLTDSGALAEAVVAEVKARLKKLKRRAIARASLTRYGAAIVVADIAAALDISNRIAPEHLEVMVKNPRQLLPDIKNAGAIFLGPWSPEPLGDYSAGPNHTLPTGGTARFSSPLGVYDFMKRSSLLEFTQEGFKKLAKPVLTIAEAEGLHGHADSVRVRMKKQ